VPLYHDSHIYSELRSYGIQSTVLEISKSFVAFTLRRKEVIIENSWSGAYLLI